ncbi:MAG TPA: cytochrome c oxidase subunit II [Longimicrobiales bacterium]|nr:cytochrome c oxidase subunit II [Longimicrobiales bacterium]
MNFWTLPESFSTFGDDIDAIFLTITWVTVAIFFIVEVALVWFIVKYRHREGQRALHIHGSMRAELIWTAVPFLIVMMIAVQSAGVWFDARFPGRIPENAYEIAVRAKQFEWTATYPGADDELGTEDDFTSRNVIHLPADTPVVVHLTAEDVIHSFFVPELRVKQDAVPGMAQRIWFEMTEPGEYVLGCAELCGLGHYRMKGRIMAYTNDDFMRWDLEQRRPAVAVAGTASTEAGGAP